MARLNLKKYLTVIAVIMLLIFLHYSHILTPPESFINYYTKPVLANIYGLSAKLNLAYNRETDRNDLLSQVQQLKDQVNRLTSENAILKMAEIENQYLRQQLKFLSSNNYNYQIANIVSRGALTDVSKNNQTVMIDKGSVDGIKIGFAVVSPNIYGSDNQGVIIGKVSGVKDHLAEIDLITNPQCKLAAAFLNRNKTSGIIHGELGLTVKMEFIPQTDEVNVGDLVVTSGLEQDISSGLVIGKVAEVIKENNNLWQSAKIDPMINADELLVVAVLIP